MNVDKISNYYPQFKGTMYFKKATQISKASNGDILREPVRDLLLESKLVESIQRAKILIEEKKDGLYKMMAELWENNEDEIEQNDNSTITMSSGATYEVPLNVGQLNNFKSWADDPYDVRNKTAIYYVNDNGDLCCTDVDYTMLVEKDEFNKISLPKDAI